MQEVEEGQPLGVMIGDCNDKGNAKLSGKIVKGLFLCSANDIDLKYKTFDQILDISMVLWRSLTILENPIIWWSLK